MPVVTAAPTTHESTIRRRAAHESTIRRQHAAPHILHTPVQGLLKACGRNLRGGVGRDQRPGAGRWLRLGDVRLHNLQIGKTVSVG
jgi:hypothetical protein